MQISDLRVLIAGCGSIGKRHAQVLRGLGVQALSACDPSAESREGMRAVLPDEAQAQLLGVAAATPLLSVERIAYTYNDVPMELRRGLYRTDTHHYLNQLS